MIRYNIGNSLQVTTFFLAPLFTALTCALCCQGDETFLEIFFSAMSFFNLTQLGPQNPFHSVKKDSETPSEPGTNSKDLVTLPGTVGPSYSQPPPSFTSQMYGNTSRDTSDTAATTTRRGGHALPHQGSHAKLSEMRIKHQRSEDGK